MTATDEVQRAVALHRAGELVEAQTIYKQVLAENPEQPDALHFLGLLSYQTGNPRVGLELIQRALVHSPYYADAHSNLGNILKELGHYEAARTSYENAISCAPEHLEAHNNLGVLLRHMGDRDAALESLLTAVMLAPEWAWAHFNLGTAYATAGHPGLAVKSFERAISLDASLVEAYRLLGFTLYGMKKFADARRVYKRLLELDPGNETAEHLLAAISGRSTPDRASPGFVRESFAQFAPSFDGQLERLSYRGPELIESELRERLPPPSQSLRVLDMGCGTGLCGPVVAPWASRLVGVDLSPEMLARAAPRSCYHELVEADLIDYLGSTSESFDLIVAADTLIYFGDLGPMLRGVAECLAPGGQLLFTLERLREDEGSGFRLGPSGRYAHDRTHVENRLRSADLALLSIEVEEIRKEFGEPVSGLVVRARRE